MSVLLTKRFWKFCCIIICISFSLPKRSHHQRISDQVEKIFFRKCCEEDQVYEFVEDKCVDRNSQQLQMEKQKYPINFIHNDFSV